MTSHSKIEKAEQTYLNDNIGGCWPAGEPNARLAGEPCGVVIGEALALLCPDIRGDGFSCGDADPFCLVRFICKQRSGWSR